MRLCPFIVLFTVAFLSACNSFSTDKKVEHPKNKPHYELKDAEFQKLRKQQDSIHQKRNKETKGKGIDTLRPMHA